MSGYRVPGNYFDPATPEDPDDGPADDAEAACRARVGHELEACGPDCVYFDEPRTCNRCGWEEQQDDRETYCRPDLLHDYPADTSGKDEVTP